MLKRSPTLAPFRHSSFRDLWTATLVSNLGGLVQAVGAGWLMTTITDSKSMVALVQGATTLPIMLFSLASGALADNFDRRRIMLTAQILMMLASVVGAYYYLRVVWYMYFEEALDKALLQASLDTRVLMSVNGLAVLGLGLLPGGLWSLCLRVLA